MARSRILRAGALALLLWPASGCSLDVQLPGPPKIYCGTIVDAETGEPIAGAGVALTWIQRTQTLMSAGGARYYDSREAVSGVDGRWELTGLPRQFQLLGSAIDGPFFDFAKAFHDPDWRGGNTSAPSRCVTTKMRRVGSGETKRNPFRRVYRAPYDAYPAMFAIMIHELGGCGNCDVELFELGKAKIAEATRRGY